MENDELYERFFSENCESREFYEDCFDPRWRRYAKAIIINALHYGQLIGMRRALKQINDEIGGTRNDG